MHDNRRAPYPFQLDGSQLIQVQLKGLCFSLLRFRVPGSVFEGDGLIGKAEHAFYFDDALDDLWNNDIDVYRNRGRHRYLMGLFYLQE